MRFTSRTCDTLRSTLTTALTETLSRDGLSLNLGRITYTNEEMRLKITVNRSGRMYPSDAETLRETVEQNIKATMKEKELTYKIGCITYTEGEMRFKLTVNSIGGLTKEQKTFIDAIEMVSNGVIVANDLGKTFSTTDKRIPKVILTGLRYNKKVQTVLFDIPGSENKGKCNIKGFLPLLVK